MFNKNCYATKFVKIISPIGLWAYGFYRCEQCQFKIMYLLITILYFKGRHFDSNMLPLYIIYLFLCLN